jgi:hypothetical protein
VSGCLVYKEIVLFMYREGIAEMQSFFFVYGSILKKDCKKV